MRYRSENYKLFIILSIFFISCFSKGKETRNTEEVAVGENLVFQNTFTKTQDSLRAVLLKSKPNQNIKSSLLQELYARGLVAEMGGYILLRIPFNLHSFDCSAPDCYATDISFSIPGTTPIKFPEKVNFKLITYGCGLKKEVTKKSTFKLMEKSANYINYYSEELQSYFVIFDKGRMIYYFENLKTSTFKVEKITKLIEDYKDDDPKAIIPYRSSIMETNDYTNFIKE